jgi:hypothetical protein
MLPGTDVIKKAVASLHPRTPGVRVDEDDIRVGLDSTDDEAVWVYVIVPDERIEEFYEEWTDVRRQIKELIQDELRNPEMFVYVRMKAASEVEAGDS